MQRPSDDDPSPLPPELDMEVVDGEFLPRARPRRAADAAPADETRAD